MAALAVVAIGLLLAARSFVGVGYAFGILLTALMIGAASGLAMSAATMLFL